ncbi:MmgE/PrpD family protein [Rhodopila sp.]|uniref:MmgE/PrpD family protein n=1 Tax=Rhodopila sp. TaxID=2480087 RepID=UPI003D11CE49
MTTSASTLLAHATGDLAAFASGLTFEDIPPEVVQRAKQCLLDGIGVCLHGAALPWTRMVQDMVIAEGGNATVSIWGRRQRSSWSHAVLANSTAGHAFEMDDMHKESVLHPNSITVPIALGYAEMQGGLSGTDVLTAIIAGYEIGTRVGNAATTQLFLNGFHPQGTTGTFAASVVAGKLLGLDTTAMHQALGSAGSMASGLMAAQEGAMVKRLHAGRAAQGGVYAALLARRGFTGISDVLEAPYGGFLSSLSREPDMSRLTSRLGDEWETLQVGFKMYPCVTSIHAALDALQELMRANGLQPEDIKAIEAGVGHMTYVHTAWPYKPAGTTAAQMNIFFGLATLARGCGVSPDDYAEGRLADPALLAFLHRITVFEDPEINAGGRQARHACRMTVTTRRGERLRKDIYDRRGSPENPVDQPTLETKFRNNVRHCLADSQAERVMALVAMFEHLESTKELTGLLSGAGDR